MMAADKAAQDPRFLGYVLHRYKTKENVDDEQLADILGTSPAFLSRLFLCRRPDPQARDFAATVATISDYTLSNPGALAKVIRHVDALEGLAGDPRARMMAAAREHEEPLGERLGGTEKSRED